MNTTLKNRYMLLSRLLSDCDYFLNWGDRDIGSLWAGSVKEQIAKMLELWHSFKKEEKPQWLTLEAIQAYETAMLSDHSPPCDFQEFKKGVEVYTVEQENGRPRIKKHTQYPIVR